MAYVVTTSRSSGKCRVARRLHAAGATSPWSAQAFEPRSRIEQRGLDAALATGLVVRTESGAYFVDPGRYEAMRVRQRWALIIGVAVMLVMIAVLFLTGE